MTNFIPTERDICTKRIIPALEAAGWDVRGPQVREEVYFTRGPIIVRGKQVERGVVKKADFILDDREIQLKLLQDDYRSPLADHIRWRNRADDKEGITGEALLAQLREVSPMPSRQTQSQRTGGFECLGVLRVVVVSLLCIAAVATAQTPPPFLSVITNEADYELLEKPDFSRPGNEALVKFSCPVRPEDPALLPTLFVNMSVYPGGHYDFLRFQFPEMFAGMTVPEYFALIGRRATRQYFSGGVYRFRAQDGSAFYGFDFYMDYNDPSEQLTAAEVAPLYDMLARNFVMRPFAYVPRTATEIANVESWGTPPFPVYFVGGEEPVAFESYTNATNYGRVRFMTLAELNSAQVLGELSWQDILVLDGVPFDIEGVIAGAVTGQRQSELSHLAVRTGRRGTPNIYLRNPRTVLSAYEGRLVRFTAEPTSWRMDTDVTVEQAEAWWAAHRPRLARLTQVDHEFAAMPSLLEMESDDPVAPLAGRFGGKAAGLARMYAVLPLENQTPGFAIPFYYHTEFMETNTLLDKYSVPQVQRTYQEYIERMLADSRFRSDSVWRARVLLEFRDTIESQGQVSPALVSQLATRIESVFGSRAIMVRFRSSSNVEDTLIFNGAGLYDSTSACVLDSFDSDNSGPSRCDSSQPRERTLERALKRVWASLWNFRAYEEREYFQIPHDQVAMAVLVTTAYPDEASNGVAFTGDPASSHNDLGYVINVQLGDESVVQPSVDVLAEKDIIRLTPDGELDRILRARPSSLMPPGTWVLSDAQLLRLAQTMALVEREMPVDHEEFDPRDVLLDFEFKFTQSDALILKQVRPFLRTGALPIIAHSAMWLLH